MDSVSNLYNLSSPSLDVMKQGTQGQIIELKTNSIQVKLDPNWKIYSYRVVFQPADLKISVKKKLLLQHSASLRGGCYIYEGANILCFQLLTGNRDSIILQSSIPDEENRDEASETVPSRLVTITLTWIQEVAHDSPRLHGVYNKMIRKLFGPLGLRAVKYEDVNAEEDTFTDSSMVQLKKSFVAHGLLSVSFRPHETCHPILTLRSGAFLCYRPTVLDNIEPAMEAMQKQNLSQSHQRRYIEARLIGKKVHVKHLSGCFWNKIVGVRWDDHALADDTSDYDDTLDYMFEFERRHHYVLESDRQPLIQLTPMKQSHRNEETIIFEVPAEVCLCEGIKAISEEPGLNYDDFVICTNDELEYDPSPEQVMGKFFQQLERISSGMQQQIELFQMGRVSMSPFNVFGRVLAPESLIFKNSDSTCGDIIEVPNTSNDFLNLLQAHMFLNPVQVVVTLIVAPKSVKVEDLNGLIEDMGRASRSMGILMQMCQVLWMLPSDLNIYTGAILEALSKYGRKLRILVLITQDVQFYINLKRFCTVEQGVFSYFYGADKVVLRNARSIQRLVLDINVCLGGVPFNLVPAFPPIPEEDFMVVGCTTYRHIDTEPIVLAMTTTMSSGLGKIFSAATLVADQVEDEIGPLFRKCVADWFTRNLKFPEAVVFYREDLRRDQLFGILEKELEPLQNVFIEMGVFVPITYVVVGRSIHNVLLIEKDQEFANPPPGTVLDDVLTTAECFDFFLVSKALSEGTSRPTYYEVLFNGSKFTADQIQKFTFRQCHLCFTAGNTIRVPAVTYYARKLARFTVEITKKEASPNLSHTLYYLDYKQFA